MVVGGEDLVGDLDGWVAAARRGDALAFERIWTALAGQVAGYLRARGVREPDDATSEVFLAAFRAMSGFVGDGSAFRAWLFTIAHHRAVDSHRALVPVPDASPAPDTARREVSAEDQVMSDEKLLGLLRQLPQPQREVVWLRVVLDLSVAEVCRITGRSPSAVKQLQRRGLDRLRRHLNGAISTSAITVLTVLSFAGVR